MVSAIAATSIPGGEVCPQICPAIWAPVCGQNKLGQPEKFSNICVYKALACESGIGECILLNVEILWLRESNRAQFQYSKLILFYTAVKELNLADCPQTNTNVIWVHIGNNVWMLGTLKRFHFLCLQTYCEWTMH